MPEISRPYALLSITVYFSCTANIIFQLQRYLTCRQSPHYTQGFLIESFPSPVQPLIFKSQLVPITLPYSRWLLSLLSLLYLSTFIGKTVPESRIGSENINYDTSAPSLLMEMENRAQSLRWNWEGKRYCYYCYRWRFRYQLSNVLGFGPSEALSIIGFTLTSVLKTFKKKKAKRKEHQGSWQFS